MGSGDQSRRASAHCPGHESIQEVLLPRRPPQLYQRVRGLSLPAVVQHGTKRYQIGVLFNTQ